MTQPGAMTGRTVLVTGGTGGIGKATAAGLAALGAHVAITGRDRRRAEEAAADIRAAGGPAVDVFVADMSSQAEVRRLAADVLQAFPRLDVLVNNVGGFWNTRHVTADGLERTFALNHLAPFLLTHLLLDRLKENAPARVVTVSSGAQAWAASTSPTSRASGRGRASGPTTSPNWPTCSSPTSSPADSRAPASPPTCCIRASSARRSAPRIPAASSGCSLRSCGRHEVARTGRGDLDPPGLGARGRARLRPVLRQQHAAAVLARSYDEAVAARLWDVSCELTGIDGRIRAEGRRMKVGVHLVNFTLPDGPPSIGPTMAAVARAAEDAGVDNLSLMDHYLQLEMMGAADQPMLEGYTSLGFLAGLTSTVELQLLVTGVTYRHPGLLAKIVSTLDVLSGGRAVLGIGAAWYEREHRALGVAYPPLAERFERLEETLQIVRQMWSEDDGPFEGKHYQLAETINSPQPLRTPPILIGGGGEKKTLRLVAKYADRCNLFAGPDPAGPAQVAAKLDVLREHCAREGTDYDRIDKTVLYAAPLAPGADAAARSPRRWPPTPPSGSPRCTSCRCTATRSGSSGTSAST